MLKWFRKLTGSEPEAAPDPNQGKSLFQRLKERLTRTQRLLVDGIRDVIGLGGKVDEALLEQIEEILIRGDVGARSAEKIVDRIRREARDADSPDADAILEMVRATLLEILDSNQKLLELDDRPEPFIILVVGVNGTGKTTTIGKLALQMAAAEKRVLLVAADTFRAAAVDQLEIWATRVGAGFVRKEEGADPAAVCFEALESIKYDTPDIVMIDTAGRLHTKTHLMAELDKMIRTIKRHYPDAPHETLLVLDATTGQNALSQLKTFSEVAKITGIIMTKLDGTAKGGILVALKEAFPLPIYKIGIGESPEDLRDFNPEEFVDALFAPEGQGNLKDAPKDPGAKTATVTRADRP